MTVNNTQLGPIMSSPALPNTAVRAGDLCEHNGCPRDGRKSPHREPSAERPLWHGSNRIRLIRIADTINERALSTKPGHAPAVWLPTDRCTNQQIHRPWPKTALQQHIFTRSNAWDHGGTRWFKESCHQRFQQQQRVYHPDGRATHQIMAGQSLVRTSQP